jgi:tripartite-type tricarboxylate transporter receptor subunit TctC
MKRTFPKISNLALAFLLAGFSALHPVTALGAAEDVGSYPSRAITIVVGYPSGGATDIIARLVAIKLGQAWGKPVIVENKAGAGSNIATEQVVRADPDGYTLLVQTIANATNMSVYKNLKYDTQKDLAPIVQFMSSASVLVVNPDVPAKNLKELIALAKAKPGKLDYVSSGVGGSPHLAGEMFKSRAGIDIVHIPYKGAAPALNDVLSGHASMGFMTSLGVLGHMQSGRLRPIAVASPKRLSELPDVPTMAEAGLPNFHVLSWNGLAAPVNTPRPIVDKLNKEVNRILNMPDVKKQMQALGAEPGGGTSDDFSNYVNAEIKKWAAVVKTAGFSLD